MQEHLPRGSNRASDINLVGNSPWPLRGRDHTCPLNWLSTVYDPRLCLTVSDNTTREIFYDFVGVPYITDAFYARHFTAPNNLRYLNHPKWIQCKPRIPILVPLTVRACRHAKPCFILRSHCGKALGGISKLYRI